MKRAIILSLCAIISLHVAGQKKADAPGTKVIAASSTMTQDEIKDKLVRLALNNPGYRVAQAQRDKTLYELNKAGGAWLNYVVASVNLNEVSMKTYKSSGVDDYRNNLYYPLWNVGINVPLGSLIGKPNDVKIARRNVGIATENKNLLERQLKKDILSRYQDYVTKKELLRLQTEIAENDFDALTQSEAQYSTGSITYEEYSTASKRYNMELVQKINLERDLNIVKLEIEEIIGVPLDDVLSQKVDPKY